MNIILTTKNAAGLTVRQRFLLCFYHFVFRLRLLFNEHILIAFFQSFALHTVNGSAEIYAVSAGLFVFHIQNLRTTENNGIVTRKNSL